MDPARFYTALFVNRRLQVATAFWSTANGPQHTQWQGRTWDSTQHQHEDLYSDMGAAALEETTADVPMGFVGVMGPSVGDTISGVILMALGSSGKSHQREAHQVGPGP